MALTTVDGGMLSATNAQYTMFKNRIINGAMVIDQRNAGASVTPGQQYLVDRWLFQPSQASKFTAQQNQGAVTPPAGFKNYLGLTSTSAYTLLSADYFVLDQRIEGYNFADFDFGTANAKTFTVSFWVYASLTGTYGLMFYNSAQTRGYNNSFTVSASNTWQYVTVTVPGDTTGSWNTTNSYGIGVRFSLGAGSGNQVAASSSWGGSIPGGVTGQVNPVSTNGATFYITGVQLEKGSTATAFDYRPYGTELQLCQRYFEILTLNSTTGNVYALNMFAYSATDVRTTITYKVTKRAAASCAFSGTLAVQNSTKASSISSFSFDQPGTDTVLIYNPSQSGFTVGVGLQANSTVPLSTISYSAEL